MKKTKIIMPIILSLILVLSALGVLGLNITVEKTAVESEVSNGTIVTFILNVTNSDTVNVTNYWLEDKLYNNNSDFVRRSTDQIPNQEIYSVIFLLFYFLPLMAYHDKA